MLSSLFNVVARHGVGQTVVTLTSIAHLIKSGYLNKVLIVAPIRVCRMVWRQEARKWSNTEHLKFSMVVGSRDHRTRALLNPNADIYLINYENLRWLSQTLQTHFIKKKRDVPFDGVVWDEVSKMKNSATKRVTAVKPLLKHLKWRTGLTGTPASNGYKDLHGQFLMVDGGERLGTSKTQFRTQFYYKQGPFKEVAFDDTEVKIKSLIGDITLEMSAEDHNPLPDLIVNDVWVDFDTSLRAKYDQFEKEMFTQLDDGATIERFNAAALTNTCLQFSNGSVYPIPGLPAHREVHSLKLDALEEIIDEANGQPILLSYAYRSDAERIMHRFAHLRPINLTQCKSDRSLNDAMTRWRTNDCPLMIGHAASMGHGVDGLQKNGHILVWFGLTWSLDLYEQFNARIRRQGQGAPVMCHRILTRDTLDIAQSDALGAKASDQSSLRKAIKNYRMGKS